MASEANGSSSQVEHHEVIIIGGGICGISQLQQLVERGVDVALLEACSGPGGTWYNNRYPGCRFDSESYTYGLSFSDELLDAWHWKERFSGQPENLRYVNHIVDMFDLRRHMQFDCIVEEAHFVEASNGWRLRLADAREFTCHYLVTAVGCLSTPTLPRLEGMDDFAGPSFHSFDWPHEPLDLSGKRVAVVGTGASGVQIIGEIADKVGELVVFQRRPNWCAPLNNSEISDQEMEEIRSRWDEIFAACAESPGGFEHVPDPRSFFEVDEIERLALWEKLYQEPGFGIWLQNFREIYIDERANAEFSAFIADKIRERVDDPVLAEKLIPTDHGFGVQRVPLETRYYEAYNLPHVRLVSLTETPIERITESGIQTADEHFDVDVIVYATGFNAFTGPFERMDVRGVDAQSLAAKWDEGPVTYLGIMMHGFPNLITLTGPQSGGSFTNFPRAIELMVEWSTALLDRMWSAGYDRFEADADAEQEWVSHVEYMLSKMLLRRAKSWFTGYNSNVAGHENGKRLPLVYAGGHPRYRDKLVGCAENDYAGITIG